jgi:hypothetical protein
VLHILIVLVADVFHQLCCGLVGVIAVKRERPGVGTGIVDRDFVQQLAEIGAPIALDRVQLFGIGLCWELV